MNCFFRETSAKNGDNVQELFTLVATELLKTIEPEPVSDKCNSPLSYILSALYYYIITILYY